MPSLTNLQNRREKKDQVLRQTSSSRRLLGGERNSLRLIKKGKLTDAIVKGKLTGSERLDRKEDVGGFSLLDERKGKRTLPRCAAARRATGNHRSRVRRK